MKKQTILLIFLFDITVLVTVSVVLFNILGLPIDVLTSNWKLGLRLLFTLLSLSVSLMVFLISGWFLLDEYSKRQVNRDLQRILENRAVHHDMDTNLGQNLNRLSIKMRHLTASLQKTENAYIETSEDIVKRERRRIARDLHDTVSQELFASSMMLSGLIQTVPQLTVTQLQDQLTAVERVINDAQKDLRVLLLHLRPTELEGKTLSEGLQMILRELTDKANIQVTYQENLGQLPRTIEENLFRIAQEFISNTLKHANAKHLEVYAYQTDADVELKMLDDGRGFDIDASRELSYGIKNIQDRVEDMAGTVQMLSSEGKGVSMTIKIPLMKGEENG